jgi:hypothetical protein
MTCSKEMRWVKTDQLVSTLLNLRCSYCNKVFTTEQAIAEEAEFQIRLAQKPSYSDGKGMTGYMDDGGWG